MSRIAKVCQVCTTPFEVKRANGSAKFCSIQCVGISQRGRTLPARRKVRKQCEVCSSDYVVSASHADRHHCCSRACSFQRRSLIAAGDGNANWRGGMSRLPYPWNFRSVVSKAIIERDGGVCQNPSCAGLDERMTAHHINYDKQDCDENNLIALCSACNSRANFGRDKWREFYSAIMKSRVCSVNRVSSNSKDNAEVA
jgi:hypothetical protein